jgi:hypothetical protein
MSHRLAISSAATLYLAIVVIVLINHGGSATASSSKLAVTVGSSPVTTPSPIRTASTTPVTSPTLLPTATIPPTAIPTVTPPPAKLLLARAISASTRYKSVHVSGYIAVEANGHIKGSSQQLNHVHILANFHGDSSSQHKPRVHLYLALQVTGLGQSIPTTIPANLELILVGQQVAVRMGNRPWQCTSLKSVRNGAGVPGATTSSSPMVHLRKLVDLGPDMIQGVPVWHVRLVYTVAIKKQQALLRSDIYIDQSNYLVRRYTAVTHFRIQGLAFQEMLSADLSRYGEHIQILLPSACQHRTINAASILLPFFSNHRFLINLSTVVRQLEIIGWVR